MNRVLVPIIAVVVLAVARVASADIITLYQWQMGDQDSVVVGDAAPAITKANVGGSPAANLSRTGSGTVVNSTSAALGLSLTGNVGGALAATSYYANDTIDVGPTDAAKWGFDAVVKFAAAPGAADMVVMSVGGYGNTNNQVILQSVWGCWALHRPGTGLRVSLTPVDALEHHIVMAGGDMYMDGAKITSFQSDSGAAAIQIDPAAGITIGAQQGGVRDGLNGEVSFARVFEYTGTFAISDVPEPSSIALMASGLLGLLAYAWRRRK